MEKDIHVSAYLNDHESKDIYRKKSMVHVSCPTKKMKPLSSKNVDWVNDSKTKEW